MPDSAVVRPFDLGLALAGGVSCGAYTAGVVDFVVEALDAWQAARGRGDEDAPDHDVRVRVIGGASSGALTAAVLGAVLPYEMEPVRATTEPDLAARNPLFDSWVNMTGLEDLLGVDDARDGRVRSLLDPAPVDKVARKAVEHTLAPRRTPRNWLADPLRILFSVASLQGVRYSLASDHQPGDGQHATQHAEVMRFAFTGVGRDGAGSSRRDERVIDHQFGTPDAATRWQTWGRDFATAALASGAVPFALPSRRLSVLRADREELQLVLPGCRSWPAEIVRISPICDDPADGWRQFDAVDGGLVDNDTLDLVRAELNDRDPLACSPREPANCWHAAVLVDPLLDGASVQAVPADATIDPPGLLGALARLLIDQARVKPADLALARKDDVYTRYLVTPGSRQVNEGGGGNLAGASLGGFGGYLSRDFRLHDFLLGRRNAQQALATHLALPSAHRLFAQWTDGQRQRYAIAGGKEFPIIPLVGKLHPIHGRSEEVAAWPTFRVDPSSFGPSIDRRLQALYCAIPSLTVRLIGYAPWRLLRPTLRRAIVRQLGAGLRRHGLQ